MIKMIIDYNYYELLIFVKICYTVQNNYLINLILKLFIKIIIKLYNLINYYY